MERGGNFRGGRGFGRGRGNGRGGRGRGRGRGRGGGRGGRGGDLKQQRRHDEPGYASYPPPQHGPPRGYPSQQGYPPQDQYPPQFQAQHLVPPPYEQHGYSNNGSMYLLGTPRPPPPPHVDRYPQPMENGQVYPNQPSQQYPHYQQVPPPSLPQQYQQTYNEKNPPMPPVPAPPPPIDYAEAVRTRQQAYAPVPRESDQQVPYHEASPPVPPCVPAEPRPDWNHVPPVDQVWYPPPVPQQWPNQPSPSQFHGPGPYNQVPSTNGVPVSMEPLAVSQRQDRPPPPTYVCHNCHQPGHWKHHCPSTKTLFRARPSEVPLHGTTWAPCVPPQCGYKPQDPRKNPGSLYPSEWHPPPPLPPVDDATPSRPATSTAHPVYTCPPCQKTFTIGSQYEAHVGFHVTCTQCPFTASKRVVGGHFQTVHGQYAGHGYKEIEVEGQTFRVLVGNSADDICKWRAERRHKWLAMAKHARTKDVVPDRKRKWSLSSEELEEGEIEEDEEARAMQREVREEATARGPGPVDKKPRKTLCKYFARTHCRLDAATCPFSHDRALVGCRAFLTRASCRKGRACPFSHDQAEKRRVQATKHERVKEEQWRGDQTSLLRRLVATDVRREQLQLLEIVHYLVANEVMATPMVEDASDRRSEEEERETENEEAMDVHRPETTEQMFASPTVNEMALVTTALGRHVLEEKSVRSIGNEQEKVGMSRAIFE